MKLFLFCLIFILTFCVYEGAAQPTYNLRQNNVWAFPDRKGIDFNTGTPVSFVTQSSGFEAAASVCNAEGQLLFYTDGNIVWDRDGQEMPNGRWIVFQGGGSDGAGPYSTTQGALIVPVMGTKSRYYLFSLEDKANPRGGLFYSIIDMSLNGGKGDIVAGQKGVYLDMGLTERMTAVGGPGCNVWLIVKPRNLNYWKSYEITAAGINRTPVISTAGTIPTGMSDPYLAGIIRLSTNGKKLVSCCSGTSQVEVYDFDVRTGLLSNPFVINNTTSAGFETYSACFSPDNSRLYVTGWIGNLRQYDLTQPTPALVASSVVVLAPFRNGDKGLGHLKLGPDGKIYCGSFGRDSMHIIQSPDALGTACNLDTFTLPLSRSSGGTRVAMPNDIALPIPDTVYRTNMICFWNKDEVIIRAADTSGISYEWQDSMRMVKERKVQDTGVYTVKYSEYTVAPCTWYVDTFKVVSPPLPFLETQPSCSYAWNGMALGHQKEGDTTTYLYSWMNESGSIIRQTKGSHGDSVPDLKPGNYTVRIQPAWADCDTVISFTIKALPAPVASFAVERDTVCPSDTILFKNTSADPFDTWYWSLGDSSYSSDFSARHAYKGEGAYDVMLTVTSGSCRDSFTKTIYVKAFNLGLLADKELYEAGEIIRLETVGSDPYRIDAWAPKWLFDNQNALIQEINADSSMTYMAWGISDNGCLDSAELYVKVNSRFFMPTAFSPNGDGNNDRFKPYVFGGSVNVIRFSIYNRWGNLVWSGYGNSGNEGWDGTYNGNPADMGTYFYSIKAETSGGTVIEQKGDLSLMR